MHEVVHMIASPRNISTAMMYSFARREHTRVIDEPFYAYYLEKTGVPHPGFDEILASQTSNADEVIRILEEKAKKANLFIKNMSQHIEGLDLSFLLNHKILLLIRDPKLQIASFSQVIDQPVMRDIGIKAQFDIYSYLRTHKKKVTLVDAWELLKDPKMILEQMCISLKIPFTERMLNWDAGPIAEDGVWAKYWYLSVHQSTGFKQPEEKDIRLQGPLSKLYEEAKPYYDQLRKKAIKAN
jgi:hypothetical protein